MSDNICDGENSAEAEQEGKSTLLLQDGQRIDGKLNGYVNDCVFNAKGERHPFTAIEFEFDEGRVLKTWVRKDETHIPVYGKDGQAPEISGNIFQLDGVFSKSGEPLMSEVVLVGPEVNQNL